MNFAQKQAFRVVKGLLVTFILTVLLAGVVATIAMLYVIAADFLHNHLLVLFRWIAIIAGFWFMGYLWDTRLKGYVVKPEEERKELS